MDSKIKNLEVYGFPKLILKCIFCEGIAELNGRWSNAKVLCTECGMEVAVSHYENQIQDWQDKACEHIEQKWKADYSILSIEKRIANYHCDVYIIFRLPPMTIAILPP